MPSPSPIAPHLSSPRIAIHINCQRGAVQIVATTMETLVLEKTWDAKGDATLQFEDV